MSKRDSSLIMERGCHFEWAPSFKDTSWAVRATAFHRNRASFEAAFCRFKAGCLPAMVPLTAFGVLVNPDEAATPGLVELAIEIDGPSWNDQNAKERVPA